MGYSFRLAARAFSYAPSHRQDSTYHDLCCTSRGALAGTRNSPYIFILIVIWGWDYFSHFVIVLLLVFCLFIYLFVCYLLICFGLGVLGCFLFVVILFVCFDVYYVCLLPCFVGFLVCLFFICFVLFVVVFFTSLCSSSFILIPVIRSFVFFGFLLVSVL